MKINQQWSQVKEQAQTILTDLTKQTPRLTLTSSPVNGLT